MIEKLINTKTDPALALKNAIDFKKTLEKINRQPNGRSASMVTFSRPAEGLRLVYELLKSDDARTFLADQREDNPFFRAIDDAMKENPLPPFSKLEKYFTTSGSVVTNEESGIHQMSLTLRLDEEE